MIRDRLPLDAVDLDDFAAGEGRWRFIARLVRRVLHVDGLIARFPLVPLEDEGARTGRVRDLGVGIRLRNPLRHHEGHVRRGLPERAQHQAGGLLSTILNVFGLTIWKSFTKDMSFWPIESLAPQRLMEATQSSAVTGLPSCHASPSRRVSV